MHVEVANYSFSFYGIRAYRDFPTVAGFACAADSLKQRRLRKITDTLMSQSTRHCECRYSVRSSSLCVLYTVTFEYNYHKSMFCKVHRRYRVKVIQ